MKPIALNLLLLVTTLLSGQSFNLQLGTSVSQINWVLSIDENSFNYYEQPKVGFSGFLGIEYLENKHFNLSSNIGYIQKGAKSVKNRVAPHSDIYSSTFEESIRLDYFSVNTIIEGKIPIKDKWIPFLGIGPRFDYIVNHSEEFSVLKESGDLNELSVGFLMAGGVKFRLPKMQFGLRADYYLNVNDIAEVKQSSETGLKITDQTMAINFIVGYLF